MIIKFKLFEGNKIKPDVNLISPEFWKMVRISDWKSVIEGYHKYPTINKEHKKFQALA